MSSPYDHNNRPKIQDGGLTFVWRTNALPKDFTISGDAISFRMQSGQTLDLPHAKLGNPYALRPELASEADLIADGYQGIYELQP